MLLLIFIIVDILLILTMAFTPYVTRKTEVFGVSLPANERGNLDLKKLCASYRNISIIIGAVFFGIQILLAGFEADEMRQVFILTLGVIIYIGVSFAIYFIYHKRMRAFKENQVWHSYGRADAKAEVAGEPVLIADTDPAGNESPSALWLLLYPVIAIITIIIFFAIWPNLPEQIPIHSDINGVIDGWALKSESSFATILWPQWLLLGIFALTYLMIRISKRQIDAANPSASRDQGRRFRKISSGLMILLGAIVSALMGATMIFMMIGINPNIVMILPLLILAICIVLVVVLYVYVGQGGSRLQTKEKSPASSDKTSIDDDRYWIAGIIYFNKKDPSFIIEKRFGIGWTFNFAHPAGIAIGIGIIAIIVWVIWFTANMA